MDPTDKREDLVRRIQLAYSGELGAAIAYGQHAVTVSDAPGSLHPGVPTVTGIMTGGVEL